MKNTLGDLQNHLFAQLERLGDEDIKGDALQEEIGRAKAISEIGSKVIENGRLVLDGQKFMENKMDIDQDFPKMLEG